MIRLHKFLAMLLMRVSLGTAVQVFMAAFRATQLPSASIPFSVWAASRVARKASLGRSSFWLKGLSAAVLASVLVDRLRVAIKLTASVTKAKVSIPFQFRVPGHPQGYWLAELAPGVVAEKIHT